MFPLGAERAAKVAFRRGPATAMPRQFGPISARAVRTHKRQQLLLSLVLLRCRLSANPAEMTTSARTPSAERFLGSSEDMLARNRRSLRDRRDPGSRPPRRSRERLRPRRPWGSPGRRHPVKSPSSTLRKSSPPIVPRRGDAPTTATLVGSKNERSDATTAVWSRSSTLCSKRSVAAIGNSTSTTPPRARA